MSELPWENKKIAEIMSSAGNEAKLSPDATGKNNKATSPIPDILANAFADMQMEEVQIEAHESASVVADDNMPQMTAPSFGDLPDLSLLGGIKSEGPKLDMQKTAFPPFMNSSGIPATLDKKESIAQDIPKMSYDNVFPSATPATHSGESSKKRSPPPLFQPFILSDGDAGAGPHLDTPISSAPRYKSAPLPFQPSQSISDKLPSPNPLPLSVPLPPDPGYNHLDPVHAVGVDPFASSPANVPGSLGNNPSIGVNPFASSPANAPGSLGDTPSIGVNPFASSPANAPGSLGNNPSIGVNPFASSPANVPGSL
ncbi:hypothetical protein, partial [Methanolobus psychrotolerans]|uniref:hypothetical protein n=1 Tax=Methanolobus psychrotolerans TaxID=1874706 RepID=UPI001A9305DD